MYKLNAYFWRISPPFMAETWIGYRSQSYEYTNHSINIYFVILLQDWIHCPHTLRQLCRISVRSYIGRGFLKKAEELPLPQQIQDYVTLREVEDHPLHGELMWIRSIQILKSSCELYIQILHFHMKIYLRKCWIFSIVWRLLFLCMDILVMHMGGRNIVVILLTLHISTWSLIQINWL